MAQDGYPADPKTWQSYQTIEADAAMRAKACVFTTPGAARLYQARYPSAAHRMRVIENGYDEESFEAHPAPNARLSPQVRAPQRGPAPFILLHSGLVYPSERDPTQLFAALSQLQATGQLSPSEFRLRFRASGHEGLLQTLGAHYGVSEFIECLPALPYRDALEEMMAVDALLVMQASNCNAQIPAKLYEYLRAGQPILGLTDPTGDTAWVLKNAGIKTIAKLDCTEDIAQQLPKFLHQCRLNESDLPTPSAVQQASRRKRSESLVRLLNEALQ
jgi:glycosyltransferase involved in cell wall biosynthesis